MKTAFVVHSHHVLTYDRMNPRCLVHHLHPPHTPHLDGSVINEQQIRTEMTAVRHRHRHAFEEVRACVFTWENLFRVAVLAFDVCTKVCVCGCT